MMQTRRGIAPLLAAALVLALGTFVSADQAQAQRLTYSRNQPVYPAFEGWRRLPDGTVTLMFGYMNENWDETPTVPIGPDNFFSPGPADRGQPTHFLPRRNRFIFEVPVPEDFDEEELVWTLRLNDKEYKAYGSLREDYFVDNVVIMSETGALGAGTSSPEIRANIPPEITLETPSHITTRVGEPVTLTARVVDDEQPPAKGFLGAKPADGESSSTDLLKSALENGFGGSTVNKAVGLYFTWFVYRGMDSVEFEPAQVKPWEDTRTFANSPWAPHWVPPSLRNPSELPEDDRWTTTAVFHEPGTYVLRGRADDGGLYSDVEVTVEVRK